VGQLRWDPLVNALSVCMLLVIAPQRRRVGFKAPGSLGLPPRAKALYWGKEQCRLRPCSETSLERKLVGTSS